MVSDEETLQLHIISHCSHTGQAFHASVHLHRVLPLLTICFPSFSTQLIKFFSELYSCFCPTQIFLLHKCSQLLITCQNYSHQFVQLFKNILKCLLYKKRGFSLWTHRIYRMCINPACIKLSLQWGRHTINKKATNK